MKESKTMVVITKDKAEKVELKKASKSDKKKEDKADK